MRRTKPLMRLLNALLDSPDKVRYVDELVEKTGQAELYVRRTLNSLVELQWLAEGLEMEPPGGHGRTRRKIYRLTDFGVREGRAFLDGARR